MLFEYINLLLGMIKLVIYKTFYFKRIKFCKIPFFSNSTRFAIKKGSILIIGNKVRTRNNVSFRLYNNSEVIIGNNCFFNDGCSINSQKSIKFGDNVICGQNVMFFDHDHDYKNNMDNFITDKIEIGNNVWIGANAVILKGVKIGDNVVVAAGTVVRKNVESNKLLFNKTTIGERNI